MAETSVERHEPQVEVLPAQPVGLDTIIKAAHPLLREWTAAQRDVAKEETARLKLALESEGKSERSEFTLRLIALLATIAVLAVLLWYGIASGKEWVLTHTAAVLAGGFGGYGAARARNKPSHEEAE